MKKYHLVSNQEGSFIVETSDPLSKMCYEGGTATTRSQAYDSIEELRKGQQVPEERCRVCGSEFSTNFMEPIKSKMLEHNQCFSCNFWTDVVEDKEHRIIIDGVVYRPGNESAQGMRGFGGRRWDIKMNDGTIIQTTNLWCNGDVPERFKEQLPDNATLYSETILK